MHSWTWLCRVFHINTVPGVYFSRARHLFNNLNGVICCQFGQSVRIPYLIIMKFENNNKKKTLHPPPPAEYNLMRSHHCEVLF